MFRKVLMAWKGLDGLQSLETIISNADTSFNGPHFIALM
jgi:hypothetical protein